MSEKAGENIGVFVENKHINRLEINLEYVINNNTQPHFFDVQHLLQALVDINALHFALSINIDLRLQQTWNTCD